MRAISLVSALLALAALTGCHGMVKSYDERKNTYAQVLESDMRQLVDDWDTFWLADREYRMTEWITR